MNIRKLFATGLACTLVTYSGFVVSQEKTEVKLMTFFGNCEAEYGKVIDVGKAHGECGILTVLINKFNATNTQGIVVKHEAVEWGAVYDQLSARIAVKNPPTVSVMHESMMGDYVALNLLEPLDEGFKSVGLQTSQFTDHARVGTTMAGKTYALPFDTHAYLWHINTGLLKAAGLTQVNGAPVLPKSADELLQQARRYKQATGKPYISWGPRDGTGVYLILVSLVAQQGANLFSADGRQIDMQSPAVRNALELMGRLKKEGLMADDNYLEGNKSFRDGEVAVRVTGTWHVEDFLLTANKTGSPFKDGYVAVPLPQLYAKKAVWADGHSWVMPKGGAKDEKTRKAALTFLKFLWDNNYEWTRTGQLPANRTALEREDYKAQPNRNNLMEISRIAVPVPIKTPRQRAIQFIVGEELQGFLNDGNSIEATQKSAEKRVNKLLATTQSR